MKKLIIISWRIVILICFFMMLIIGVFIRIGNSFNNDIYVSKLNEPDYTYYEPEKPLEGSVEELYQDIFVTLLLPYIDKAVDDYYGVPYTVAPYWIKILSVERPKGYRTFHFIVKIETTPYTGPHNSVGVDHITIKVSAGPTVIIEKFEHIKSYELP